MLNPFYVTICVSGGGSATLSYRKDKPIPVTGCRDPYGCETVLKDVIIDYNDTRIQYFPYNMH